MRIKAIRLSWFRGAADPVALEPDCKSMAVYGGTGSGKSSFVDAVEYVLNDGKIGHLTHEYSGRHQEKAIPNTHKPDNRKTELKIKFKDDSELKIEIKEDGSSTSAGAEAVAMGTWDYRRTVLRQGEIAEFIRETKGHKYSALLPLLGLHEMEVAAENLRQLARAIERESKIRETKDALNEVKTKRRKTFGTDSDEQIVKRIEDLHSKYCPNKTATEDVLSRCTELKTALDTRIPHFSGDQKRHVVLQDAAALNLRSHVDAVRSASVRLASAADPLISEKLEVLQSAGRFVDKLGEENEVQCPACGRSIPMDAFQTHVKKEQEHLQEINDTFNMWKAAIGTLCDTVKSLKSYLGKTDVKFWRDQHAKGALANNFAHLDDLNAEALRTSCGDGHLKAIEANLLPLIDAAAAASKGLPP